MHDGKSKKKPKKMMTIQDFAKCSSHKDQGNKRQRAYNLLRWKKHTNKNSMYFSHLKVGTSKNKLPKKQNILGHCILCPKQFYGNLESNLVRHFRRVQVKRELKCCGTHILFCKCCEVPNRGTA